MNIGGKIFGKKSIKNGLNVTKNDKKITNKQGKKVENQVQEINISGRILRLLMIFASGS